MQPIPEAPFSFFEDIISLALPSFMGLDKDIETKNEQRIKRRRLLELHRLDTYQSCQKRSIYISRSKISTGVFCAWKAWELASRCSISIGKYPLCESESQESSVTGRGAVQMDFHLFHLPCLGKTAVGVHCSVCRSFRYAQERGCHAVIHKITSSS